MIQMALEPIRERASSSVPRAPWRLGWSSLWWLLVVAVAFAPVTLAASLFLVASDLHRRG